MSVERRNLLIAIVAAFVFGVSGGVVGTLATVAVLHHAGPGGRFGAAHFMHRPGGERGERGGPGGPHARRTPMERFLSRQLDLSDEQRTQVEAILDAARPRYAAVRDSTHAAIERILTPAQVTKMKQIESRFPARRGGEPGEP